jgi:protein-tyrosine phosphatase
MNEKDWSHVPQRQECLVAKLASGGELWVGDWYDAQAFLGEKLCVLENVSIHNLAPQSHLIPILEMGGPLIPSAQVNMDQMGKALAFMTVRLDAGVKLLVHCAAGIERSPLTCAYWLRAMGVHSTLAAAYTYMKIIRPIVEDRTVWLPMEHRLP